MWFLLWETGKKGYYDPNRFRQNSFGFWAVEQKKNPRNEPWTVFYYFVFENYYRTVRFEL